VEFWTIFPENSSPKKSGLADNIRLHEKIEAIELFFLQDQDALQSPGAVLNRIEQDREHELNNMNNF
jgi:hypothetical protein